MTGAAPALARCVGDPEEFLRRTFGASPHRWSGDGFDDLLSLADVDSQLSGAGLRRPAVRLVRDGEVLDPASWTRRARTGSIWVDDLVHPGRAMALFGQGATIVLQSLHRWWPPLTQLCRLLEDELGHAVQANAYLTPPGAAGLTPHHDTHDVFVLQVHGAKHWTVRQPMLDAPLPRHRSDHEAAARQPVLFEHQMRPGDAMYLPRGFIHSAAAQEGVSLHVTVGVLATTVHDLLRQILDRAGEDAALRRSLPPAYAADAETATGVVKSAVAELVAWLERLDVGEAAGALVETVARRRAPSYDGHLLDLAALPELQDASRVVRRPPRPPHVVVEVDLAELALADRRVSLPAAVAPAVELLLDGEVHAVADVAGFLDGPSRLVLVRRLIREGALRRADGP